MLENPRDFVTPLEPLVSIRRRISLFRSLVLAAALASPAVQAAEIVLYDNTLGNAPNNQDWMTFIGAGSVTQLGDGIELDTRTFLGFPAPQLAAGYFNHNLDATPDQWSLVNPAFPVLDAGEGFTLGFEMRMLDEDHLTADRAGFSVILLDQNNLGVELGFWEDRIWAQSGPGFTQDPVERVDFTTTLGPRILYELTILGADYFLAADGAEILSGSVKDYSPASPNPDPYGTPNFVFLGDDTGSASAQFELGRITLTTDPFAVPASGVLVLMFGGLGGLSLVRRSRRVL